jgi:hypothetical protein
MAKFIDDSVFDAALANVATATRQCITSAQPANFAGIAAGLLADNVVTAGLGSGDFSAAANGDVSGRKTTVLAQTGVVVDTSGTGNHVTLDTGTVLKHVTTFTGQALTAANTVNIAAYDVEFLDVTP